MKKPTVSACLITKNEEKFLPRCLESIRQLVDQIIVVDTGSTNRTVDIARRFGARVEHFEWCDDFAAARNYSLKFASSDWILIIDADEELCLSSVYEFLSALQNPQALGYWVWQMGSEGENVESAVYAGRVLRLFRRHSALKFKGRLHEQIPSEALLAVRTRFRAGVLLSDIELFHQDYSED